MSLVVEKILLHEEEEEEKRDVRYTTYLTLTDTYMLTYIPLCNDSFLCFLHFLVEL